MRVAASLRPPRQAVVGGLDPAGARRELRVRGLMRQVREQRAPRAHACATSIASAMLGARVRPAPQRVQHQHLGPRSSAPRLAATSFTSVRYARSRCGSRTPAMAMAKRERQHGTPGDVLRPPASSGVGARAAGGALAGGDVGVEDVAEALPERRQRLGRAVDRQRRRCFTERSGGRRCR